MLGLVDCVQVSHNKIEWEENTVYVGFIIIINIIVAHEITLLT